MVNFEQIINKLKDNDVRYVVMGSRGLILHGFHLVNSEDKDVDLWIDPKQNPSLVVLAKRLFENDQYEVKSHNAIHPSLPSISFDASPHVDWIGWPQGFEPSDFESVYVQSLSSPLGKVAGVNHLIQNKVATGRVKDFRHVVQIMRQVSNLWGDV